MDRVAVEQAQERLEICKAAFEQYHTSVKMEAKQTAWSQFILAAAGVYSKLEQGSQTKGKSSGWFGRKSNERKSDQLLRYIHHARNSDEHSIDSVSDKVFLEMTVEFSKPPTGDQSFPVVFPYHDFVHVNSNGDKITYKAPHLCLRPVHDRGVRFEPPTKHLGESIRGTEVTVVGELTLSYLESLLEEARLLAVE